MGLTATAALAVAVIPCRFPQAQAQGLVTHRAFRRRKAILAELAGQILMEVAAVAALVRQDKTAIADAVAVPVTQYRLLQVR